MAIGNVAFQTVTGIPTTWRLTYVPDTPPYLVREHIDLPHPLTLLFTYSILMLGIIVLTYERR